MTMHQVLVLLNSNCFLKIKPP